LRARRSVSLKIDGIVPYSDGSNRFPGTDLMKISLPMRPANERVPSPGRRRVTFGVAASDGAGIASTLYSVIDAGINRTKVATLRQAIGRGLYLVDCGLVAEGVLASVRFGWRH
jgi:hypothetical protein